MSDLWDWFDKGVEHAERDRLDEAIATFAALAAHPKADASLVAWSLAWKAWELKRLGEVERSIDVRRRLIARFGDTTDPEIRGLVAESLNVIGWRTEQRGHIREALRYYRRAADGHTPGASERHDESVTWARDSIRAIQRRRAKALVFWGGVAALLTREVISSRRQ